METTVKKTCSECGKDVSQIKRVKDARGHYYCHECWAKVTRPSVSTTTEAIVAQDRGARSVPSSHHKTATNAFPPVATLPAEVGPRAVTTTQRRQFLNPTSLLFVAAIAGTVVAIGIYFAFSGRQNSADPHAALLDDEQTFKLAEDLECGRNVPPDATQAFVNYKKGADHGYAKAEFGLANSLFLGRGTIRDKAEACRWFRKAAEAGYGPAMHALGELLADGDGVAKNQAESESWFAKAGPAAQQGATLGDPHAMAVLGIMASNGDGTVKKDNVEAVRWYQRAAELGDRKAMYFLANAYRDGVGIEKNEAKALEWYRKGAELNSPACMTGVGEAYQNGAGIQQSYPDAIRSYQTAIKANETHAMENLAGLYFSGKGVDKDLAKGVSLLKAAAALDDSKAMYALGVYYSNDDSPQKDMTLANSFYRDAAARGNEEAIKALATNDQKSTVGEDAARRLQLFKDHPAQSFKTFAAAYMTTATNSAKHSTAIGYVDSKYTISVRKTDDELTPVLGILDLTVVEKPNGEMKKIGTPFQLTFAPSDNGWELRVVEYKEIVSFDGPYGKETRSSNWMQSLKIECDDSFFTSALANTLNP